MEENREMLELLRKIEEQNAKQLRAGRLRCVFSGVSALCIVIALVLLVGLLPRVNGIMEQADSALGQVGGLMGKMETVLTNLERISEDLAEVDLEAMVSDVDTLVSTAQGSLEQTMEKLNAIDFETLNEAIEDLAAVIEPLANLADMFP